MKSTIWITFSSGEVVASISTPMVNRSVLYALFGLVSGSAVFDTT